MSIGAQVVAAVIVVLYFALLFGVSYQSPRVTVWLLQFNAPEELTRPTWRFIVTNTAVLVALITPLTAGVAFWLRRYKRRTSED